MKTPKEVMRELLEIPPADRKKVKPSDGFEEVAKTYLETALETKDPGMLKYIIELVEDSAALVNESDMNSESKVKKFERAIQEAIL